MKHAKSSSLWELTFGGESKEKVRFRVDKEKIAGGRPMDLLRPSIGNYIILQNPITQTFQPKTDIYMADGDRALLENFLSKRHQTLGDLLTINRMDGSSIISSLEKLVSFGLIRRDWEKEAELHIDVVYSLTPEGHYIATQKPEK